MPHSSIGLVPKSKDPCSISWVSRKCQDCPSKRGGKQDGFEFTSSQIGEAKPSTQKFAQQIRYFSHHQFHPPSPIIHPPAASTISPGRMEGIRAAIQQMGVRERIEVMSSAMQGISEAEKREVMQGWCQRVGDFELSWIQDLARQERWEQSLRRNQEEGREEMPMWMERMQMRASNQGSESGSDWWRERIREWEEGGEARKDEMQDGHGTGRLGEGVRREWRAY